MQASSAYSIPQTALRAQYVGDSGLISGGCSCRCRSSARISASSLNVWRTIIRTTVIKMFNRRGESTHPYRSPWFTSNGFEHVPSLDRTHAFIPAWNSRITVIICGGTPRRGSTCHSRFRSTKSQAFWMSLIEQRTGSTPAFRPSPCSRQTTNIMSMVYQDG